MINLYFNLKRLEIQVKNGIKVIYGNGGEKMACGRKKGGKKR